MSCLATFAIFIAFCHLTPLMLFLAILCFFPFTSTIAIVLLPYFACFLIFILVAGWCILSLHAICFQDLWGCEFYCYSICRAAAAVMLSGQIADGFTTIFAGELVSPKLNIALWELMYSFYFSVLTCPAYFGSMKNSSSSPWSEPHRSIGNGTE